MMDFAEVKSRRRTGNKTDGFIVKADDLNWLFAEIEALTAENTRIFAMVDAREQTIAELTALCDGYRGEVEGLRSYESAVKNSAEYQKGYDMGRRFERQIAEESDSFEANRLRRLATICGIGIGNEPDEFITGCAGTILGSITRTVEGLFKNSQSALPRARAEGMEEGSRTMRTMAANAMRRYHNGLRGGIPATVIMSLPLVTEAAKGEQ